MQEKLAKAEFTFDDFLKQIQQMRKMGPMRDILAMVPGLGSALGDMPLDEHEMVLTEAIIQSMTRQERAHPHVIDAPRRRRIAAGAGVQPHDVSGLVKSFDQMRDVVKQIGGAGVFGGKGKAATQALQKIDLFGHAPKKRQRSKRKKTKGRKKRSR
jgi:signal recognition particle subunit SRP54